MAFGFLFVAGTLRADEPAIIAKARARLGTDAALDSITSIHYAGTLVTAEPNDPAKIISAKFDMIVQKPDRQLIITTSEKLVETTVCEHPPVEALTEADMARVRSNRRGAVRGQRIVPLRALRQAIHFLQIIDQQRARVRGGNMKMVEKNLLPSVVRP